MKKNYLKSVVKMRMACLFVLLMTMFSQAFAGGTSTTYYYQATAGISPTGRGKVYVATQSTNNPDYKTTNHTITGSQNAGGGSASVTFYYYAQANTGWIFDHWAQGSANGTSVSTSPAYSKTESVTSTSQNNRTSFTYYAVFKEQTGLVKVYSENNNKGSVSIDNPNNVIGNTVTMTASPDISNGVYFLGWRKGSATSGDYVSTDNPYSLTVSNETAGNYYACFSEPQEKTYCRLRNRGTGRFLTLVGNTHSSNHQGSIGENSFDDGFIFTNSLKLISATEAQGNPSTVFLRSGNPSGIGTTTNVDLSAHGVSYKTNLTSNSYPITMLRNNDGSYKIFTTVTVNDQGTAVNFSSYLCDEGSSNGWAVMKTGVSDTSSDWDVYLLDEQTQVGALGANTKAKFTQDGKYYTTMYTDFDYKLLDGVKAYYLPASSETVYDEENHLVEFTEVTTGVVPAHTAVVLECTAVQNTNATGNIYNRLLPLVPDSSNPVASIVGESLNLLKGYVSLNGSTRANDMERMYVLSMNNERLGFYHYSKSTMTPEKAYLELPEVVDNNFVKDLKFGFGHHEDETTDIRTLGQYSNADKAVFDLMGRKVADNIEKTNRLPKGIYISNGKTFIVK